MMRDRDRAELREILAKHKLLFLRPKYREEQMIEEDKGLFRLLFFMIITKNTFRFGGKRNL